ncbi:MAG TPA: aspartate kinase [Candidatus Moranbacteria bacterium]|nr:aspartate kinase [Candidatus Moranbacteria bacterium]
MDIIVSKFGGTSVGSQEAIEKLREIVLEKEERKIIVVSAVSGVTDLLIKAGTEAKKKGNWKTVLADIRERHLKLIKELDIVLDLSKHFKGLEAFLRGIESIGELTPRSRDYILSFGERLSSKIIESFLEKKSKAIRINSKYLIKTNETFSSATLDMKETRKAVKKNLLPKLEEYDKIIITGFIGSTRQGEYTTFSRGGSDYSAAILANILDAKELEIWTDVDGILTANPKIIPQAKVIKNVNYREASELSYFGAKVLHPKTIEPVVEKGIPARVVNTFNHKNRGTLITEKSKKTIKSVSSKNGSYIINLYSTEMLGTSGFMAKIFSIFLEHSIVIDVVSTSESSISLTTECEPPTLLVRELEKHASVEILKNKTIISLVGEGLGERKNILYRLFGAVKNYSIRMVSQGALPQNITLVVDKRDEKLVIRAIYREFFN